MTVTQKKTYWVIPNGVKEVHILQLKLLISWERKGPSHI